MSKTVPPKGVNVAASPASPIQSTDKQMLKLPERPKKPSKLKTSHTINSATSTPSNVSTESLDVFNILEDYNEGKAVRTTQPIKVLNDPVKQEKSEPTSATKSRFTNLFRNSSFKKNEAQSDKPNNENPAEKNDSLPASIKVGLTRQETQPQRNSFPVAAPRSSVLHSPHSHFPSSALMAELNSRLLGRKTDEPQSSPVSDAVSTDSRKPDDVSALNSKIQTRVCPNRHSVAREDRSDSQSDNGSVYHTPGTGTPNRLSRHTDSTHSNYESPKTMTPQNSQMIPGKTRDESTLDRIKHILPSSSSSVLFDRPKSDSLSRQSTVTQVMPDTSDEHQDIFTGLFEDDASLKLTALDQSLLRHHGPLNMKVILNSKKKAMQSWSQYYIFLYFGLLICFKENPYKAKKPRGIGIIDIAKATIDTAGPIQTKRKFAFILTTDRDQELIFQAADEKDLNAWIKHITDDITVRGDQEWETYLPTSWKLKQQLSELPINQDAQASGNKDPLLQSRSSSSSLKESLNLSSSTEFPQKWSRRSTDSKPKLSLLAKGSSKADVEEPKSPSLVFGGFLDAQYMKTNHIPTVLEVCTKLVELKCKDVPELYNLSGNHARIANLKKLINDGDDSKINWNAEISEDIKVITGLIKDYFKDLPTPLIPCELYSPLLRLYKNSDIPPSERQIRLSNIMCHLTVAHRLVLKFILAHLKVVSSWHEKTLQDSHDLAVVFAGLFVRLNMMQDAASAANGDGSVAAEGTEVDSVVIVTIVEELIMNYDQILI